MTTAQHNIRIYKELCDAGIGTWAMRSLEAHYVPSFIHEDEHIGAAVSGFSEGSYVMLIATDRRIIYLDRKPIFTNIDELAYDIVVGVKCNDLGLFAGVELHTRLKDYSVGWVREKAAHTFVHFIETRRLENIKNGYGDKGSFIAKRTLGPSAPKPQKEAKTKGSLEKTVVRYSPHRPLGQIAVSTSRTPDPSLKK